MRHDEWADVREVLDSDVARGLSRFVQRTGDLAAVVGATVLRLDLRGPGTVSLQLRCDPERAWDDWQHRLQPARPTSLDLVIDLWKPFDYRWPGGAITGFDVEGQRGLPLESLVSARIERLHMTAVGDLRILFEPWHSIDLHVGEGPSDEDHWGLDLGDLNVYSAPNRIELACLGKTIGENWKSLEG